MNTINPNSSINDPSKTEDLKKNQQQDDVAKITEEEISHKTNEEKKSQVKQNFDSKLPGSSSKPEANIPEQQTHAQDLSETASLSAQSRQPSNGSADTLGPKEQAVSYEELIADFDQSIRKLENKIDQYQDSQSALSYVTARPETRAFAVNMMSIDNGQNQDLQQLRDDVQQRAARQTIKVEAQRLQALGKQEQALRLLQDAQTKPESILRTAREIIESRRTTQYIQLNLQSSHAPESPQQMLATSYQSMSRDEQQDHTLELMSGLLDRIDVSSSDIDSNKAFLDELISSPGQQQENGFLSPQATSLFNMTPQSNPIDPRASRNPLGLENSTQHLTQAQRDELTKQRIEILARQIEQRESLMRTKGQAIQLLQAARADDVHLLFDAQGQALSQAELERRAHYSSDLPDEIKTKYQDLTEFLKRDQVFETSFASLQDSLVGLSPEEQVVRVRDAITEELQATRSQLDFLQDHTQEMLALYMNPQSDSAIELAAIDQSIINTLSQETLHRRADMLFDLHDNLTRSLNSADYQQGKDTISEFSRDLQNGLYTLGTPDQGVQDLLDRDLARTPQEDKEIEARITELEEKFKASQDTGLARAEFVKKEVDRLLGEFNTVTNAGGFNYRGIVATLSSMVSFSGHHEADALYADMQNTQSYSGTILDGLLETQESMQESKQRFTETNQLEKYARKLESLIETQDAQRLEAGQAMTKVNIHDVQALYHNTDTMYASAQANLKFVRNAAIAIGVTVATGGAAAALASQGGLGVAGLTIGGGWSATGSALGSVGLVSTSFTSGALVLNSIEGVSRYAHGVQDPNWSVIGQTYEDGKMILTTSGQTMLGIGATRYLADVHKWGRVASSMGGGMSSSFAGTNARYGIQALEGLVSDGKVNIDPKQYLKDLFWDTSAGGLGGGIGAKFGAWQDVSSSALVKSAYIAAEELTSTAAELGITIARDGKLSPEGLMQSFQTVLTSRAQAHFAHRQPINKLAQDIKKQDLQVRSSEVLPEGVEAQTTVRVEPDGTRKVDIELTQDLVARAAAEDTAAQKIILEETSAHALENPIDPQVKQSDGSYQAMEKKQYLALRARQELAMRSVAESKQVAKGESVSVQKQKSKAVLAQMTKAINEGDYNQAMRLAQENGIGQNYRDRFNQDYDYNANRNREKDALIQTSYSADLPVKATSADLVSKITSMEALTKKPEINGEDLARFKEDLQAMKFDELDTDAKARLADMVETLRTKGVADVELMARLAYLSTNEQYNVPQQLGYAVDAAFTKAYEASGRDPNFVKDYIENNLTPRLEEQASQVKALIASGADDAQLKAAVDEFNILANEKLALGSSHVMNTFKGSFDDDYGKIAQVDGDDTVRLMEEYEFSDAATARQAVEEYFARLELGDANKAKINNTVDQESQRKEVLRALLGQIDQVAINQTPRIRTEQELSNKDILESLNAKIEELGPDFISKIINESTDPELTREALRQMSQFGNLSSLNDFVNQLYSLKQDGYRIMTESNGSLADTLAYLGPRKNNFMIKAKDNPDGDNQISKLPQTTRLSSFMDINPTKLKEDGTDKIAIVLDQVTMDSLKSNPDVVDHLKKIQDEGIELKLVYPRGWNDGINPFTAKDQIQSRVDSVSLQAQKLIEQDGLSYQDAVNQVLDRSIQEDLRNLGLLENLEIFGNTKLDSRGDSDQNIADGLNGQKISQEKLDAFLARKAYNPEDQAAIREVLDRDLQVLSPREIAEITQRQHREIMALAASKGISPDKIYFLSRTDSTKSDQIMLQIYQQANNLSSSQIVNRVDLLPKDPNSMIVVVDDVSISGQTQLELHSQMRINDGFQGEIVMATAIATTGAKQNILDPDNANQEVINEVLNKFSRRTNYNDLQQVVLSKDSKLHVLAGKEYTPLFQTEYFQNLSAEQKETIRTMMQKSGRGHNGDSTSIIMPWMAPNNNNGLIQRGFAQMITLNGNGVKSPTKQEQKRLEESRKNGG